ncbi:hypothetical protein FRC11_011096, partial [Ceratobasidium sp. 423]
VAADSAIKRWDNSRDLLENVLSSYLNSCISLEVSLERGDDSAKDLASRFHSAIDSLHYGISRQLSRPASIITRARNKLVSIAWCLPEELLSNIFLHAVYAPEYEKMPIWEGLWAIYRNPHNLMAICSVWRNVAMSRGELWAIVPVGDDPIKYQAIELSLERSRGHALRLATTLPWYESPPFKYTTKAVIEYASRVRALNVQSIYLGCIAMITEVLQAGVPSHLPSVRS